MKRRWKILLGAVVILAALLVVNSIVTDKETKAAEVTIEGAEILELQTVDLQVLDTPAEDPSHEGQPIVLLHGYGGSIHWWERMIPLLAQTHRVIAIDLIGHGGSEKPKSGYSMPEQAADVAEAMNQLDVQGALVVGHSMGGVVATELAAQASELVDRVALIDTPAASDEIDHGITQDAALLPVLGEGIWRVRIDPLVEKGYETAFAPGFDTADGFDDPDQVVEDNRAMTYTAFDQASQETSDYLDEQDLPSRLAPTGVPLLAIVGSEDERVDPEDSVTAYEAVPGAVVKTFDGIGHSPNVEAPADTAETLLRFASDEPPLSSEPRPKPKPKADAKPERKRVEGRKNRPPKRAKDK